MSDDINDELAESAVELADKLGEPYLEEVSRLIRMADFETLHIFYRAMQEVEWHDYKSNLDREATDTD